MTLLIPLYNIYVAIKIPFDLARAFGKSTGFGFGLLFLPPIFECILGFGDAVYHGNPVAYEEAYYYDSRRD